MAGLGRICLLIACLVINSFATAEELEDEYETKLWREMNVQFPEPPRQADLQTFFVSSASDNQFLVDLATLTVGGDGVVRYVLVVLTPEGARNVTFEGIRCESRERRVYASGRRDGSWSKSRVDHWVKIQDVAANRVHAALFLEYFCPGGVIVRDAEEAKKALIDGIHPDNKRW